MNTRKYATLSLLSLLILAMTFGLTTACGSNDTSSTSQFQTRLLVTEPVKPLKINDRIVVRARVEAPDTGVSHAELYIVDPERLLVGSQAPAPLGTVTDVFNAELAFYPVQSGNYAIQVYGYDRTGEVSYSEILRFEATNAVQ
jgi:hypothetical protein